MLFMERARLGPPSRPQTGRSSGAWALPLCSGNLHSFTEITSALTASTRIAQSCLFLNLENRSCLLRSCFCVWPLSLGMCLCDPAILSVTSAARSSSSLWKAKGLGVLEGPPGWVRLGGGVWGLTPGVGEARGRRGGFSQSH